MPGPVVSLLPARNAAADLPGHLDSVAQYADAVVALDDGSTDDTRAILERHPLVHTVLTNPRRESYAGWDDAGNRNRLLEAAQALAPGWIMSLDADELFAPDDAAALRAFLLDGADPEHGYLFRVSRMIGDLAHHDGSELWVGRLFAPQPGQTFPSDRLHFVPLPTAIPRERWTPTTFRIQHRGSLDELQRRARFAKYQEADPAREWQGSYAHLLRTPTQLRTWYPRGRLLPPIAHAPRVDPTARPPDEPAMSVVVLAGFEPTGDVASAGVSAGVRRAIASALAQEVEAPYEVVVVAAGPDVAAAVGRDHPEVAVVPIDGATSLGEARNAGLRAAQGRHVLYVDPSTALAPGNVAARIAAHGQGWPMVAGPVRNRNRTWWGGAAYFLDHAFELPGQQPGALEAPPTSCSHHRELLVEVGGFPDDLLSAAEAETAVAAELFARGYGAFRVSGAIADLHGPCRTLRSLGRSQFRVGRSHGRGLARARAEGALTTRRMCRHLVRWLPGRLRRIHEQVGRADEDLRSRFRRVAPLVVLGAVVAWCGSARELLGQVLVGAAGARPARRRSR